MKPRLRASVILECSLLVYKKDAKLYAWEWLFLVPETVSCLSSRSKQWQQLNLDRPPSRPRNPGAVPQ